VTLASQQVDKALSEVAAIIRELENLPEIGELKSYDYFSNFNSVYAYKIISEFSLYSLNIYY